MPDTIFHPPLVQIAFSVIDVRRTERWFREGLGFLPSGGNRLMMSSPLVALIQGLPRAASTCWWMVGRNPWFQLEMFQFRRPMARLMPADFRPCDTGYTRIGVTVADFDATLERLADLGSMPLSAVLGERGKRRACVRNPDGVFVEVMEDDPLPQAAGSERSGCDVAVRSVTLSSPDLAASVAYLTAIGGKAPQDIPLHAQAHEALWGLPGAKCDRAVFAFGDVLLEVVQYTDPIGKPWPEGYRLSDQRILNIAVGARNRRDHEQVHERAMRFGARPNFRPVGTGGAGCVYENDRLGFSVEVLWMRRGGPERKWGFVPLPASSRPEPDNQRVEAKVLIEAPLDTVWNVLTDQDRMSGWIGFDPVTRVRDGWPDRDGVGSERRMKGPGGTIVEQVIGVEPKRRIRYRVIEGSPFIFHNGEITVEPRGNATEVSWSIRFRSRIPLLGAFWQSVVGALLPRMLSKGLKPFAERSGAAGGAPFRASSARVTAHSPTRCAR